MNALSTFNFDNQQVRTVLKNDEVWFVASDVCEALDILNASQLVSRLDEDERDICTVYTLRGNQELLSINESGLYSLVLTSRKPEARRFKRWITHEVLPSIRKTGSYGSFDNLSDEEMLKMIEVLAKRVGVRLRLIRKPSMSIPPWLPRLAQICERDGVDLNDTINTLRSLRCDLRY